MSEPTKRINLDDRESIVIGILPYVCNACENRRYCDDDRYFYDARVADREALQSRSEPRKGIHVSDEELRSLNSLLSTGIKKGQPIAHIFAEHEDEIPVTSRTAYTYINMGILDVRNLDLRRQAGYKKRRKKKDDSGILDQSYRQGRTYDDFKKYMEGKSDSRVFEMDTVKGKKGTKIGLMSSGPFPSIRYSQN